MKSLLQSRHRRPDLIFRRNGQFDITARIARALNLSAGDSVDILADDGEFYLYVAHRAADNPCARFRAQVFQSKPGINTGHFRGSCIELCRAMIALAEAQHSAGLLCGPPTRIPASPHLLIPIIIHSNRT